MITKYKICTRCVMDTTDPDIAFDGNGVCNHCHHYSQIAQQRLFSGELNSHRLESLVRTIRKDGRGKAYDCIIGVSGGVDSTYVAYLVKKLGLRPLAVHLDNGWDSELAVKNIEGVLKALDIDLFTYVLDWQEFRDLQLAFLKASTPDSEIPTDHAIVAILYRMAIRHDVHYIINGTNIVSEAVLPTKWAYGHSDFRYIKHVHKKFGKKKLKSFPKYGLIQWFYYTYIRSIRWVSILNYVAYDKREVMNTIQSELGWIYYGGKHYESIYTRFLQAYILPKKFNIDKRRAHFSNLICSEQMTREEALTALHEKTCAEDMLVADKSYVMKKFSLSEGEFEEIMASPPKSFVEYPNQFRLVKSLRAIKFMLKKFGGRAKTSFRLDEPVKGSARNN